MPNQPVNSFEGNFTKGFVTEFTGLNFPENAATEADNCIFNIPGNVTRRKGINFEDNGGFDIINRTNLAMSSYVWNTAGGDGDSRLYVRQVGGTLYFYNIAASTTLSPLSTQLLVGTITLIPISAVTLDITVECTYADGNGYLFVYHTSCDPIYVVYNPSTNSLTSSIITVQIRDFVGVVDNDPLSFRPPTLSNEHQYNLFNQGWITANAWGLSSNDVDTLPVAATASWNVQAGAGTLAVGTLVSFGAYKNSNGNLTGVGNGVGTIQSYDNVHGVLTLNIVSQNYGYANVSANYWVFYPSSKGTLNTWFTDEGNYPSNSDIWWLFKDTSGVFNPTTTQPSVSVAFGQAPQGHFILPAFNMDRNTSASMSGLTVVASNKRPTNGCWFQGRVWYTGVNDSFPASGDSNYYTWTENIYFSKIVSGVADLGICYQQNDPTTETLNDLLETDGGVITIYGCGNILKLFPIQNGLLVFAANGVWFITGSRGIGFAANDYTITKISSVKIVSNTSFVDVLGLPVFWNEEGIYQVIPAKEGALTVTPLTINTIRSFYNSIPILSKLYARGDYDSINYVIQWAYKSVQESSLTDRYQYDSILCYNTYLKAFYTYSISSGNSLQHIHDIKYVTYPGVTINTPFPSLKYASSYYDGASYHLGFAEEFDTNYVDWATIDYTSSFTTGYKLAKSSFLKLYSGEGQKKMQVSYIRIYSNNNGYNSYYIQSLWDFASNSNSGRWSRKEFHENNSANFSVIARRHKPRGRGLVLQFKVTSVSGQPFDIIGWSAYQDINVGV